MPSVTVEIDMNQFCDDEIVHEVIARELVRDVLKASRSSADHLLPHDETDVEDAYAALMSRRMSEAARLLRDAIKTIVGDYLMEAYDAARDGQRDRAICALDKVLEPAVDALKRAA